MIGNIGIQEILVVLVIAFFIFGAKRLPELGAGLGKAIRSFQKGLKDEAKEPEGEKDKNKDQDKSK